MNQLTTIIRHTRLLAFGLCLASFAAGCSTSTITRTVALPGLPPLSSPDQVRVLEEGQPISEPYQVVGAVTVAKTSSQNTNQKLPSEHYSNKQMKRIAAEMGADGVIGVHLSVSVDPKEATTTRSGLVVKWLAPGEARRPVTRPFVVAMLPMAEDSDPHGKQAAKNAKTRSSSKSDSKKEWTTNVYRAVVEPLETKGYFVLPLDSVTFTSGLESARDLDNAALRGLGGGDAQCLLEVTVFGKADSSILIESGSIVQVKSTLLDKATRKDIFQGTGAGSMILGWLANMIVDKDQMAAGVGAAVSLRAVPPINETVEVKK